MFGYPTMIGIDTFSWGKIIRLRKNGWNDFIIEMLKEGNFFITHEVKKEYEHFYKDQSDLLEYIDILPTLNQRIEFYTLQNFDLADATLLEYTDIKKHRICTEDKPMLIEGTTSKHNIIQLADLFGEFYRNDFISAREFYQLIKILKKWKNISKKKEKQLKELMHVNIKK